MERITTYKFTEPFLDRLLDDLERDYLRAGQDLSRLAIVFGGRRPALFLRRGLAQRVGRAFIPPRFFTMDELIRATVARQEVIENGQDLDQHYVIYQLARQVCPQVLAGRETFAQFLPWTREILAFIDQLDLEGVADATLLGIQANARIGYAVPDDINALLASIAALRQAYHRHMRATRAYARGFLYRRAAEVIDGVNFPEFDQILFCNLFYLNRSESAVIKSLYARGQARLYLQGDQRRWPVFRRIARDFGHPVTEAEELPVPGFDLKLYAGFDSHSQIGLVRRILQEVNDPEHTVIVLPNPDNIIALLSEITGLIGDFNISMGYPLRRSSLYALVELVFAAQSSRDDKGYYARDYLRVLRHPLVKNLRLGTEAAVIRVLIHKIEEVLTGQQEAEISGRLFLAPDQVLAEEELFRLTVQTLEGMGLHVPAATLKTALAELHQVLFYGWEGVTTFQGLADQLERFLDLFIRHSNLHQYPLNVNIVARMQEIVEQIRALGFRDEVFPAEDLFRIFASQIDGEIMAFKGSPLKGLQVLGLFETRALNFRHVIVLDVNEGTLPRLNIYEPLIPREVMISLNLDRLEQEEEIQRYQFMRLISSAETVHLVYQENREKERSRFVEELVWAAEQAEGRLGVVPVVRPSYAVEVTTVRPVVVKTPEMLAFLRQMRYSASSVNMYLRSPLEFYQNYVLGLREREDLLEEPENRQVGVFVHELLEAAFRPLAGQGAPPVIDARFRHHFQQLFEQQFAATFGRNMAEDAFLLRSVLEVRLRRFLDHEEQSADRRVREVLFVEERFEDTMELSSGPVHFVYKVDRVDRMADGSVMIIDYKTGSLDPMPKAIDLIERMPLSREAVLEHVQSFQIPLYFHYLRKNFPGDPVNAAFYNLRTLEIHRFLDHRTRHDPERITAAFLRALDFVMAEILDPAVPFTDQPG